MMPRSGLVSLRTNIIIAALVASTTIGARFPVTAFVLHPQRQWYRAAWYLQSASGGASESTHQEGVQAVRKPKRKKKKPKFTINPIGTATTYSDGKLEDKKKERESRKEAASTVVSNLGVSSRNMPQLDTRGGGNSRARRPNRQNNRNNSDNSSSNHRQRRRSRTPPPPMPSPGQPGGEFFRDLISIGMEVFVVKKEHQGTGQETSGAVQRLLTNSAYHPRGIKVMLSSGAVGRVTRFADGIIGSAVDGQVVEEGQAKGQASPPLPDSPPRSHSPPYGSSTGNASTSLFVVDDGALAMLVDEMDFDAKLAREALEIYDNDVERAVHRLLQEG